MTDEIIIPDSIYVGKDQVVLDGIFATRYNFVLKGKDVQIIREKGRRNCDVFIEGKYSSVDISELGNYVTELVNE